MSEHYSRNALGSEKMLNLWLKNHWIVCRNFDPCMGHKKMIKWMFFEMSADCVFEMSSNWIKGIFPSRWSIAEAVFQSTWSQTIYQMSEHYSRNVLGSEKMLNLWLKNHWIFCRNFDPCMGNKINDKMNVFWNFRWLCFQDE